MESVNEHEVPAIAKINRLMSQISTNLASTLYDTSQLQDKGISKNYWKPLMSKTKLFIKVSIINFRNRYRFHT